MTRFSNAREAKEFLVSRIVAEAKREGVSLSEIERKMLYFSETGWSLPDILEVNDEFDRKCDTAEYEKKITHLIHKETRRLRKENPEDFVSWISAARKLKTEDHYVSVMIDAAGVPTGSLSDRWKTAILVLVVICFFAAFRPMLRYLGLWMPRTPTAQFGSYTVNESLNNLVGYLYLSFLGLVLCGLAFAHFDHKRTMHKIFDRIVDSIFGVHEK
jgi:hypothetical protein